MENGGGLGHVSFIVPAAGAGTRFGASEPKQYTSLLGKPLLAHTLSRILQLHPARIVLVVAKGDESYLNVAGHECCEVVTGGEHRFDSVMNGLSHLALAPDEWVMVHDAARPCVRTADIKRLYTELETDEVGGILAVPATDTVKRIEGERIAETIDRNTVYLAQTPQMFRFGVLQQALKRAIANDIDVTDEASAVEAQGMRPAVVIGHSDNIKVTTGPDLALAEYYLSAQESFHLREEL